MARKQRWRLMRSETSISMVGMLLRLPSSHPAGSHLFDPGPFAQQTAEAQQSILLGLGSKLGEELP